ncbi:MAG: CoA-binding protein, partial [Promethearchaeota archaeon]
MNWNIKPIFEPETIAVIGVSTSNIFNPGTVIFQRNLLIKGYLSEKVFGINPHGGKIDGRPLYQSIFDIPKKIDLAVSCVRATYTLQAVKEAMAAGVKGMVIISGGFSEIGREGKLIQEQISKLAFEHETPIIGPNCVGIYNPGQVNTFIIPQERFVVPPVNGNVALVSQSGGVLADQGFCKFFERNIAISKAVSLGNKAVINEVDILDYFIQDPQTDIIGFYLEGFTRNKGREFLLKSRYTKKTIIMLKGGKTDRGVRAASSHTASMASNNAVLKGALKQFSIIDCNSEQELVVYCKAFSLLAGKNKPFYSSHIKNQLAIITVSGGHGVLSSDFSKKYNLNLVDFTDDEKNELKKALNPSIINIASLENPIDLTGSCRDDDIVNILEILMQNKKVEIMLILILPYPPGLTMALGSRIASIVRIYKKPVICYIPWLARYQMIIDALNDANIPVGNTIEEALLMAYAVILRSKAMSRAKINKIIGADSILLNDYLEFSKMDNRGKEPKIDKKK